MSHSAIHGHGDQDHCSYNHHVSDKNGPPSPSHRGQGNSHSLSQNYAAAKPDSSFGDYEFPPPPPQPKTPPPASLDDDYFALGSGNWGNSGAFDGAFDASQHHVEVQTFKTVA